MKLSLGFHYLIEKFDLLLYFSNKHKAFEHGELGRQFVKEFGFDTNIKSSVRSQMHGQMPKICGGYLKTKKVADQINFLIVMINGPSLKHGRRLEDVRAFACVKKCNAHALHECSGRSI